MCEGRACCIEGVGGERGQGFFLNYRESEKGWGMGEEGREVGIYRWRRGALPLPLEGPRLYGK